MAQSPNPMPPAKRAMIVLMSGAGLILLGGGGLLAGLNSQVTSLQSVAQQKEDEVGGSEQIAKRYQTTLETFNETQDRIKYLETSVSAKSYVPTLLGQLQSLAAATHLTVMAVRPATPPPASLPAPKPTSADTGAGAAADIKKAPPPPPYDALNIDVETIGTYADTATFLYSLTRFPKILSVTGAQMHPNSIATGADPNASPTVTTSLKLVAFVFHNDADDAPDKPAAAVAAAPAPDLMGHTDVSSISAAAGRTERGAVSVTRASNARLAEGNATQ